MTQIEVRALLGILRHFDWRHRAKYLRSDNWGAADAWEHTWTRGHQTLTAYYDASEARVDGYLSHAPDGPEHENFLSVHVDYLEELGLRRVTALLTVCGIIGEPSELWSWGA